MALIDISPRIDTASPVYPGDVPLRIAEIAQTPAVVTAFEMTPHLGAHVDAPKHMGKPVDVTQLPLDRFVGQCAVIDCTGRSVIDDKDLPNVTTKRVLIKTGFEMSAHWPDSYPYLTVEAVKALAKMGVTLIGIDTPSIDPEDEDLLAHHAAIDAGMVILENLRLIGVEPGAYRLIALPLAIAGLEASPVRAVLEK